MTDRFHDDGSIRGTDPAPVTEPFRCETCERLNRMTREERAQAGELMHGRPAEGAKGGKGGMSMVKALALVQDLRVKAEPLLAQGDRLKAWHALHRRNLNHLSLSPGSMPRGPDGKDLPEFIQRAVYQFLLRSLSRGVVPDPQIALEAFQGTRVIPECGILECTAPEPHTH